MLEFCELHPSADVQETEYLRLLGFPPGHRLDGRPRELADWARAWYAENGRPWFFARRAGQMHLKADGAVVADMPFHSPRLAAQLLETEACDAMLVAVSAGPECEAHARQCWEQGRPDEYFFLEMYGSAVVEHLLTQAAGRICSWADQTRLAVLPHYSPGYSGWPISDQLKLWQAIRGESQRLFPAELQVLETGMLRPKKSLLALFGLTRHFEKVKPGSHLVPCENCSLVGCSYRRAPYCQVMPQPENFNPRSPAPTTPAGLDPNAHYTINARALNKWARERLHLEVAGDGSVKARFRYEGTTCSNLGMPIYFDYHVHLQPPAYRIAEAHCQPAAGDTGHAHMCEYMKDPPEFMRLITSEKPLLDQPLQEVLSWQRPYSPAGCHCDLASRQHKWGLVLEVIHFALAHRNSSATLAQSAYGQTV